MSTSTANVNPNNISLSPMRVSYGPSNALVDIGGTTNSVTISVKYDTADIMVDQFGKSVIDKVVSGLSFSIKFELSEVKNTDNWKIAFPSMRQIVNGGVKSMYAEMAVGDHLYPKAQMLKLHPLERPNADLNGDYTFYKTIATEASEIKYGPDKQSGLALEFIVFPDLTVSPARYFTYGDPANGMTNASAGSAVPGSNTGNGTIGSIAVFNGVTKTETITLTCLDAVSGNDFIVSGSQSGALGYVHVAAAAASTGNFIPTTGSPLVITFTVTQGSTQFVAGDSFTIATVASNFS